MQLPPQRSQIAEKPDYLDNATIAELMTREAEQADGHLRQAFRRAARRAFLWTEEARELVAANRSLLELDGIGPFLASRIHGWVDTPPGLVKPPAIRDEFLTFAQALRILAPQPNWSAMLKGDLHLHTLWSDGSATVAEMKQAATELGHKFIAITDHTKGLKIANGLSEQRLVEQGHEIDATNAALPGKSTDLVVLKSAEVNLSPLGQPDMDELALSKLDLVVGSFHSALRRAEDQTERYLAALRNKSIHILGHPQARIYDHREGLRADWSRIFAEAARLDKAVEIDGYPDRQDLKMSLLKLAQREGARIRPDESDIGDNYLVLYRHIDFARRGSVLSSKYRTSSCADSGGMTFGSSNCRWTDDHISCPTRGRDLAPSRSSRSEATSDRFLL